MEKLLFFAVIFLLVSSGSVWAAVVYEKRYEKILPITFTAIVAVLLVLGICGALYMGVFAVLFLGGLLWLHAGLRFVQQIRADRGKLRRVIACLISPGALVFAALALILVYTNYGRVPMIWDEFSHWADSVKVMATLDDFVTHPESQSWFPSYPPGMALVQYLFVRLYMLLCGGTYVDWLLYYSYQLFLFSFLVSFIPSDWRGRPFRAVFCTVMVLLVPCMFFPQDVFFLSTTYIDPFLSVLMGCGLGMVFSQEERDVSETVYICCTIFMLVLSKAAGLLLGVFVAAALALRVFAEKERPERRFKVLAAGLASVALPYLLWAIERSSSGINQSFSSKDGEVSLSLILRLISHTEESYRQLAHDNYYRELFRIASYDCLLPLPVWLLIAALILALILVCRALGKESGSASTAIKAVPVLAFLEIVIYVVGLCYTFALKFEESEAISSMGQYRYICIVMLAVAILLFILSLRLILKAARPGLYIAILSLLLISQIPFSALVGVLDRDSVAESIESRAQFVPLIDNVRGLCPEGADVYVVAQGRYTPNWQQIKYGVRPRRIQEDKQWMQLWEEPMDEGIRSISPEEWADELAENYDYVAIFVFDEYFVDTYGKLFREGSKIEQNAVYSVDSETGCLTKIS